MAEFWLRLRYVEDMLRGVLSNQDQLLNQDQLTTLQLAYEFMTVTIAVASNELNIAVDYDDQLVKQISDRYHLNNQLAEEMCIICNTNILFLLYSFS